MSVQNKSEKIQCPFDPVHVIERRRLMVHINKCKQNLPKNHDFVVCQFSSNHYVRRHKLAEHYDSCEYKQQFIAHKVIWEAETPKYAQPKLIVNAAVQEASENWDDLPGPSFNPEKLRAEAPHMTVPQGMSKSKRREFKELERERLRERELKSPDDTESNSQKQMKMDTDVQPRKPETVPKLPGRIAAKFPKQPEENFDSRSQGASTRTSFYSAVESIPGGGRGRGVIAWNSAQSSGSPRFSNEDFPALG